MTSNDTTFIVSSDDNYKPMFTGEKHGKYWYKGKQWTGPTNLLGCKNPKAKKVSPSKQIKRHSPGGNGSLRERSKAMGTVRTIWLSNKKVKKKPKLGIGHTRGRRKTERKKKG